MVSQLVIFIGLFKNTHNLSCVQFFKLTKNVHLNMMMMMS